LKKAIIGAKHSMKADMELWQAIVLAIVEGLTEYLPISSTGHIIVSSALMGINENSFVKDYTVMVQFGAIMSVVFLYWKRFVQGFEIYKKLALAFVPAAAIGFAVKDAIDAILGNVAVVAWAFIIGGVVLIISDFVFVAAEKKSEGANKTTTDRVSDLNQMSLRHALVVGVFQCLAFIPGVSRSAATILGGLVQRFDRQAAAEFSFLLAVPTLSAAGGLKLLKILPTIESTQITSLVIGNIVSFVVGVITIKAFIGYLSRHGFWVFGVYRIILGVGLLLWLASGRTLHMI